MLSWSQPGWGQGQGWATPGGKRASSFLLAATSSSRCHLRGSDPLILCPIHGLWRGWAGNCFPPPSAKQSVVPSQAEQAEQGTKMWLGRWLVLMPPPHGVRGGESYSPLLCHCSPSQLCCSCLFKSPPPLSYTLSSRLVKVKHAATNPIGHFIANCIVHHLIL